MTPGTPGHKEEDEIRDDGNDAKDGAERDEDLREIGSKMVVGEPRTYSEI